MPTGLPRSLFLSAPAELREAKDRTGDNEEANVVVSLLPPDCAERCLLLRPGDLRSASNVPRLCLLVVLVVLVVLGVLRMLRVLRVVVTVVLLLEDTLVAEDERR